LLWQRCLKGEPLVLQIIMSLRFGEWQGKNDSFSRKNMKKKGFSQSDAEKQNWALVKIAKKFVGI